MKRSLGLLILIGLLLVLIAPVAAQEAPTPEPVGLRPDAPTYAVHGPYWVGTMGFEAETDSHPTLVQIWYPALNPTGEPEFIALMTGPGGLPIYGHALLDADLDSQAAPYPFVIVAHGLGGGNAAYLYLCEHLASQGFVVMAINYADSGNFDPPGDPLFALFTRPKDVSWQIDYAEQLNADATSQLHGMIDVDHIAVVGHSFGGYTALVAGGAVLDMASATSWCQQYPDFALPPVTGGGTLQERFCDRAAELAELAGLQSAPEELWPSWADARIDTIVAMAPWTPFFGSESAKGITVPTMEMFGSADQTVFTELPLYQSQAYDTISSTTKSLVVFEQGDHSIYNGDCSSFPWAADFGMFAICSDPVWDMPRAHDLISHFTTAFLLDTLKGDKDAAAALAPDAISFPGIEYQAQGF